MENRKPSEVFLGLWQLQARSAAMTVGEFTMCAQAWRKIVSLEEAAAQDSGRADEGVGPYGETVEQRDEGIAPYAGEGIGGEAG